MYKINQKLPKTFKNKSFILVHLEWNIDHFSREENLDDFFYLFLVISVIFLEIFESSLEWHDGAYARIYKTQLMTIDTQILAHITSQVHWNS